MKTDNELIAEFMGFSCCDTGQDRFWNPPYKPEATVDSWDYHTNHLDKFRTSWDWLMPVVIKCRDLQQGPWNDMTRLMYNPIHLALGDLDIKKIYQNVIGFIAWYNSQNQ